MRVLSEPTQKDYRTYWRLANQLTADGNMTRTEIWKECERLFQYNNLRPRFKSVNTFISCMHSHNKKRRLQSILDIEGVAVLSQEDLEEVAEIVFQKMKSHLKKGGK
mgnify:CR=1 FL=1